MGSFYVVLLIIMCILCYTGQTFFNRLFSDYYPFDAAVASPVYAGIYGILVALVTFGLNGFTFCPSRLTWIFGAFNGVILFIYNLGMIQAAHRGPYAFQSIVMLFGSIVVGLVFAAVIWGDKITLLQLLGIGVMLLAFFVLNGRGLDFSNVKKGYFFWVFSLFFSNGFYGVLMDAQQRVVATERNEMIIITFASSAIISLFYLFATRKGDAAKAFQMGKKAAVSAVISSLCAAFAVWLLMILLHYVPMYVLFTVNNGSILVLSMILCRVVLKEELTKESLIGISLCIVSIVLLSI